MTSFLDASGNKSVIFKPKKEESAARKARGLAELTLRARLCPTRKRPRSDSAAFCDALAV